MSAPDIRAAVLDKLCAPRGTVTPTGRSSSGWQAKRVTGGPIASARRDTIEFLKERGSSDYVVCAVHFVDENNLERFELIGVRHDNDSWVADSGAGGGADNPPRDQPWINLAAWGNDARLCAGGQIAGTNHDKIAAVRLRFTDGTTIEDDTERGVAIFVTAGPLRAGTAELLDAAGTIVASHSVLEIFG